MTYSFEEFRHLDSPWSWRAPSPDDLLLADDEANDEHESAYDEARDEVATLVGLLDERDQTMLALVEHGLSQYEVGRRLGMSQPSVSAKLVRIRDWLARAVPRRLAMRRLLGGEFAPESLVEVDRAIFVPWFWLHAGTNEIGRRLQIPQSTLCTRLRRIRRVSPTGLVALLPARQWEWTRPTTPLGG